MRITHGLVIAAALVASGCQSLGLVDESTEDLTRYQTLAGTTLAGSDGVKVEKVENQLTASPAAVKLTLKNTGKDPIRLFSFDVEFGYPAPAGSFAPYIPNFEGQDFENFGAGESREVLVVSSQSTGTPLFTRVVPSTGADARPTTAREVDRFGTRHGSTLMGGRVEVVQMDAALEAATPRLSYTIENVDASATAKELGNLRYMVVFYKNGKEVDLPFKFGQFRPVGKSLGKQGDRVTFEVAGLAEVQDKLGGAKPVLRLK